MGIANKLVEEIDALLLVDEIGTQEEFRELLKDIKRIGKQYNDLPGEAKKEVTNINKLAEIMKDLGNPEYRQELQERLEKAKEQEKEAADDYEDSGLDEEEVNNIPEDKANWDQYLDEEKPAAESNEEVEDEFDFENLDIEDYIRSDKPYENKQIESTRKFDQLRQQEKSVKETKEMQQRFKRFEKDIKKDMEKAIKEYREHGRNDSEEEITQHNLRAPVFDEDSVILEGEASDRLFEIDDDKPQKKRDQRKKEKEKKDRQFEYKKEQLIKASKNKHDNYYDDEMPEDHDVKSEKEPLSTGTIVKFVLLGIVGLASLVVTVVVITQLL